MASLRRNDPLVAATLVDLRPWLDGAAGPLAIGVGPDGAIYAAAYRSAEQHLKHTPSGRLTRGVSYRVLRWRDGDVRSMDVHDETLSVHFIQPTANGVLLVGARTGSRGSGDDQNAAVYDWDGHPVRRFSLGDGIEDVRTTPAGAIWVSYFDEGVFSEWGKGLGGAGCVRFDAHGRPAFHYSASDAGTDTIVDVYALNVVDEDAWIYFHTGFPIVQISRGGYRVWTTGAWTPSGAGGSALAVDGARALLIGDYERRDRVRTMRLDDDGTAARTSRRDLVDEHGAPLLYDRALGVGNVAYLVRDRQVLVIQNW